MRRNFFFLLFVTRYYIICCYYIIPTKQQLIIHTVSTSCNTFDKDSPKLRITNVLEKTWGSFSTTLNAKPKSKKAVRNGSVTGFGSSTTTQRNKIIQGDIKVESTKQLLETRDEFASTQLDKWGLPPPTLEDIFPLMSNDTQILPIDPTVKYTVKDIEKCLTNYFPNNINWNHVTLSKNTNDDNDAKEMTLRLAHRSPPVFLIDNFLSVDECCDVQRVVTNSESNTAEGNDAVIRVASKTISQHLALSKRTSTSWFCSYKSIPTVMAKIQHILDINDLSRCEEPQIVKYDIGQEFTYHYDILPKEQLTNGGQRVATILIYLNTISESNGGGTTFRDLIDCANNRTTLSVQPVQGSALLFFPSDQFGIPDDRTLHRSLPVVESQNDSSNRGDTALISKWILQIWIHERSYTACLPSKQNRIEDAYSEINAASSRLGYISKIIDEMT